MKKMYLIGALIFTISVICNGQTSTTTLTSYGYASGVSGLNSSYFGISAGAAATSSTNNNCFFGMYSGLKTIGSENSFFGRSAGYYNASGTRNTYIGTWSGQNNISGSNNTFIGNLSGYRNTGSSNVFIGYSAGYNETGSNKLYIDNSNTSQPLIYGDFASDLVCINGKMGIGISNPTGKLDVHSSADFTQAPRFTMNSNSTNLQSINTSFSLFNLDQTANNWSRMHFATKLTNGVEIDMVSLAVQYKNRVSGQETADFVIATEGSGTYAERFRITGNGNVGIGTSNPGYKLAVNGTLGVKGKITAEEIEVKILPAWADYVFKPDYKLATLNEVENFITKNGHLPNVPSAKEVEENGINLGEMNKVLLEKIEELTLYMIELKKENEALNTRIKNLEE